LIQDASRIELTSMVTVPVKAKPLSKSLLRLAVENTGAMKREADQTELSLNKPLQIKDKNTKFGST